MQKRYFGPDPEQTRLRTTVDTIGRELDALGDPGAHGPLRAAYGRLVEQLALGPEPLTRDCPQCGTTGMRAATICGNCWTALVPPSA